MVTARVYPQAFAALSAGEVDWPNEAGLKMALMGTGFTFDDTHDSFADVSASEYGGTGYTAGGIALTTKAVTETDSSTLTARANTTAYSVGDVRRTGTDSGRVFVCITAGTSAASEPAGMATAEFLGSVTDGTVVWVNVGSAITIYDADPVTFSGLDGATGTDGAVVYNDDGVNEPLICHIDFEATETPTQITVTPPGEGYVVLAGGGALS